MDKSNDWRLLNDVEYLRGQYFEPLFVNEIRDMFPKLKHCVFCWDKLPTGKLSYNEIWFVTQKGEECVCRDCFYDFSEQLDLHETDDFF
ncbi:MAG: hypothetical protein IJ446_10615 [Oscillospiraceae bacterium]|nr:hypothetical protein [Oscillospiraceae bacterium]